MFVGVGVGAWWAGILHLVTHAFFKACLFLGAGSVMHGMGDETDIRKMGGLLRRMPVTAFTFGVSTLAITGFVPLSGFWSKDAILGSALFSHNPAWHGVGRLAYLLGSLAALGTAFYMSRLFFLTFTGKPRTRAAEHAHESSPVMTGPLVVLALLAVAAVGLAVPGHWFEHFTAPLFAPGTARLLAVDHFHEGAHPLWPYFAAWGIAAAGTAVAAALYWRGATALPAKLAETFPRTYRFAYDKFRVDELYEAVILKPFEVAARLAHRVVDVFAIEGLVNGLPRFFAATGAVFRTAQNGDVQRYAAVMAVAAAVILWAVLGTGG
jgi:NADH-quinone oxidoreductase subunit L